MAIYFLDGLIPGFGEQIPRGSWKGGNSFRPFFFFLSPILSARRNYEVAAGATPASRRHPASNRIRAPLPVQLVNKSALVQLVLASQRLRFLLQRVQRRSFKHEGGGGGGGGGGRGESDLVDINRIRER